MKRTHATMMLNYEHEVNVGDLKATLLVQVFAYDLLTPSPKLDVDFLDILDVSFREVPVSNWGKFRDFHKEMGIDYDTSLDQRYEEVFGKDSSFKDRVLSDLANIFTGYFDK